MELEKLKEIWTSLDNRMQQQEGLKTVIIKEMLLAKSDKALSRLINYSYFGLVLIVTVIPLLIWSYTQILDYLIIYKAYIIILIIFFISAIVIGILELKGLHKIDFSMPLSESLRITQSVNVFSKNFSIIYYILAAILYIFGMIVVLISFKHIDPVILCSIFIAVLFFSVVLSIWEYKRINRRNFDSIIRSLEELKELDEMQLKDSQTDK